MPELSEVDAGIRLRRELRRWLKRTNVSMRSASRYAGCDPNYLCSFLSADPEKWALPKASKISAIEKMIALDRLPVEAPNE